MRYYWILLAFVRNCQIFLGQQSGFESQNLIHIAKSATYHHFLGAKAPLGLAHDKKESMEKIQNSINLMDMLDSQRQTMIARDIPPKKQKYSEIT